MSEKKRFVYVYSSINDGWRRGALQSLMMWKRTYTANDIAHKDAEQARANMSMSTLSILIQEVLKKQ